jgi:hypothetical protein
MDENKLTINRLIMKHNYLEVYLQEIQLKYKKFNEQFLKEYFELNPNEKDEEKSKKEKATQSPSLNIPQFNENDEIPLHNENENGNEENSEFKNMLNKIYRKLSLKTHPDKNGGDDSLFIKVLDAYNKKELLVLIKIAESINCEINIDYTIDIIDNIENENKKIEDKIHELQHHVCWLWCHADDNTKKNFKLPK